MAKEIEQQELKNRIEAVLFATGDKVIIDEIRRLVRAPDNLVVESALKELSEEYDKRDAPLKIMNEATFWKITVREKYIDIVRRIVTRTELSKTMIETLALIAWKNPAKQSEIVDMRTNKAYQHINELIETGFVTRVKKGRTFLLKLTEKFFDYFDIEGTTNVKEAFEHVRNNVKQRKKKTALDSVVSIKIPVSSNEINL
jgi:segregation and condensation protein B